METRRIAEIVALVGLGGEASLGYLAPFGLELRLSMANYSVVSGEYEAELDDGTFTKTPPESIGRVGLSIGFEI